MILTRALPENRYAAATGNTTFETTIGDVFGAGFGGDTMLGLLQRGGEIAAANRRGRGDESRLVAPEVLAERYQGLGLTFDAPMTEDAAEALADGKRAEMIRKDVMARGPGGISGAVAGFAGGLAAMAVDPLEVASTFIPVVGPARMAALTGRLGVVGGRAATGVIEGAVGNALVEPIYYGMSRSQQLDYGMSDALLNIGLGAALGGSVGTASGLLARRIDRRAQTDIEPAAVDPSLGETAARPGGGQTPPDQPLTMAERAAPDAIRRSIEPPFPELRPNEREAALRMSVAQAAQGEPVNVSAVVKKAKQPKTLLGALQGIGIKDTGGDFAAMGVRDWDKSQFFKRNVIRSDGLKKDEAARALWDAGYLRDQPEAAEMMAAERGEGPEPDLVLAMDRAVDAELRGDPSYSQFDQAAVEEYETTLAENDINRRLLEYTNGEKFTADEVDQLVELVEVEGYSPKEAREIVREDNRMWQDGDYSAGDEIDELRAGLVDSVFAEDEEMLLARIEDLRGRGAIDEAADAEIAAADAIVQKASAVRDVARTAAQCFL